MIFLNQERYSAQIVAAGSIGKARWMLKRGSPPLQ
jgi:hypothetical protein